MTTTTSFRPTGRSLLRATGSPAALAVALVATLPAVAGESGTTTGVRPFVRPPYVRGSLDTVPVSVAVLAVRVAPFDDAPAAWLPLRELERIAGEIDRLLTTPLDGAPTLVGVAPPAGTAPTVAFGCVTDMIGECDADSRANALSTTGGTRAWREGAAAVMRAAGADHLLVLELRLAPIWIAQRGLGGRKDARLGRDHVQPLPWLTSLDTPVWTVWLTGALVDRDGRVERSGAEGLRAVRTPLRASILGAERMPAPAEIDALRTTHRDDLAGRPTVWDAAARELVHSLTAGQPAGSGS